MCKDQGRTRDGPAFFISFETNFLIFQYQASMQHFEWISLAFYIKFLDKASKGWVIVAQLKGMPFYSKFYQMLSKRKKLSTIWKSI